MPVYEFEVFAEEEGLVAVPFNLSGTTGGKNMQELAQAAIDLLRTEIEFHAVHGMPLPKPTFANKPRYGGTTMMVAVDAGLHTVPRMTAAEAARALGVSPSRISHLINKGLLVSFKHGHNTWVTRYSVEARLRERKGAGRPKKAVEEAPLAAQA